MDIRNELKADNEETVIWIEMSEETIEQYNAVSEEQSNDHSVHSNHVVHSSQEPWSLESYKRATVDVDMEDIERPVNLCVRDNYVRYSAEYIDEVMHTSNEPFNCIFCDYKFSQIYNLTMHLTIHLGEDGFDCGRNFSEKCNLKNCIRRHTGRKTFHCELCNNQFFNKTDLGMHMKRIHQHRPFECHICDYKATQKWHLERHVRKHTGERPFKCQHCEHACADKSNLRKHIKRVHLGEKPYVCERCGYRYFLRSQLSAHMKTHVGEKPFLCEVCGFKFCHKCSLVKHFTVKHYS